METLISLENDFAESLKVANTYNKLLVGVVGHQEAGKSSIWCKLFGTKIATSQWGNTRRAYIFADPQEYVEALPINGSPGERGVHIDKIINPDKAKRKAHLPSIVLCSMQYPGDVISTKEDVVETTLQYFIPHSALQQVA